MLGACAHVYEALFVRPRESPALGSQAGGRVGGFPAGPAWVLSAAWGMGAMEAGASLQARGYVLFVFVVGRFVVIAQPLDLSAGEICVWRLRGKLRCCI